MKILVTGGAGFIGTNLIEKLSREGDEIWCIDNLLTGVKERVEGKCNFIEGDICNKEIFLKLPKVGIEQIYHLACPASPPKYQADPLHTIATCVDGTRNVLEYARKVGAVVLFTSTSEVYGEPLVHPQSEEYRGNVNTLGIRACYDEGKRIAETICMEYNRLFGVNVKIVRIFNTYGPFMSPDDGRVISNFCTQALKGGDISVYGDGTQTRSLCYIDDLIKGLILMMHSNIVGPVNLGNDVEYTVREMADIIKFAVGSKSKIVMKELPKDDPTRRKPDLDIARKMLEWHPTTSFKVGVIKTIDYFRDLIERC